MNTTVAVRLLSLSKFSFTFTVTLLARGFSCKLKLLAPSYNPHSIPPDYPQAIMENSKRGQNRGKEEGKKPFNLKWRREKHNC